MIRLRQMKKEQRGANSLQKSIIFSFSLIGQIGFATAIPLVVLGLSGKYLDNKLDTGPYLFLAGLIIATFLVYLILRKIVRDSLDKMNF